MKGKKFDAHRKHFEEKEIALRQETRRNVEFAEKLLEENNNLLKENNRLIEENTEIKMKYEKLLEYSKLSEEDIQKALKRDKSLEQVSNLMNIASRLRL